MAPTPLSKANQTHNHTTLKTPQSVKQRLNFNGARTPGQSNAVKENPTGEHPVEVIGRIRDLPEKKDKITSILQVNPDNQGLRVRADFGYRDFTLDGVSISEEEDLDAFYKKFVQSRIQGVKLGAKCTIMMYGPTGSGKSHTMFGCLKQPGIVYRSLKDILGDPEDDDGDKGGLGVGSFVHVTVLEIYNEEIYDLLSSNGGGGLGLGWPKSNGSNTKVRLEVMGKKAKNATFISGTEAGKISKEIQKVEKRRIVKSTLCNERSSRSHCMIILDVPTVGGRLMLVDMAGSENIEAAGQVGFEAKMQTAKINQGNIALKRVVESIANGDSHVPFRDSKLTMLLQDSFEDDKSKILMILCASPDPKEIHKTISTLEYGAKAKCIVRGPHSPVKDKFGGEDSSAAESLGLRIAAMDQFICKLQMENKEAHKELMKKEKEVTALKAKLHVVEGKLSEEQINMKVNERTQMLKCELEKKLEECQKIANDFIESERRRMEERMLQQEQELEMLRRRLEEIESQVDSSSDGNSSDGSGFAKRLIGMCPDEDPGMVKSMDLDMSDLEPLPRIQFDKTGPQYLQSYPILGAAGDIGGGDVFASKFGDRMCLSTVFEEEEEVEDGNGSLDDEVEKGIIEEKTVCTNKSLSIDYYISSPEKLSRDTVEPVNTKDRQLRIQNIFTLCGNNRELSRHCNQPTSEKRDSEKEESPIKEIFHVEESITVAEELTKADSENQTKSSEISLSKFHDLQLASKENCDPSRNGTAEQMEVIVRWGQPRENSGKSITSIRVVKDASLADLRKLIEIYLGADNQAFTFLWSGESIGGAVPKEKEATMQVSKLPICSSNSSSECRLACLRPASEVVQNSGYLPLVPLENKLPLAPLSQLVSR